MPQNTLRGSHRLAIVGLFLVVAVLTQSRAAAAPRRDSGGSGVGLGNDPRFGVVQAFEAPQQAGTIGVRWERIMFQWANLQPTGSGDWNAAAVISDASLNSEIAAGRTPVGILLDTPQWAARDPQYKDASVPANLDQPWSSPSNNWGAFVHRIVTQYKGRIDNWIIWNEPDRYNDTKDQYYNWHGSLQDYYSLMKTAYLAAHDANPGCTVVMSGLTYWWDKEANREQWLQRYLELAAQDPTAAANHDYFDAANTHLYANPLNAYAQAMTFHRILQTHGGDRPVWITESNVIPTGDPGVPAAGAFRATLDQQASFVIEDLALALASGAPRISIYKMTDGPTEGNGELYGLVRNDGSTRPAYQAYAVADTYFSGATSALYTWHPDLSAPSAQEIDALLASDANRYQFVWPAAVNTVVMQRPGQRVTVVWDAAPVTATAVITAIAPSALLVDKTGATSTMTPQADGAYHLSLEPSSNNSDPRDRSLYLTGGSPLILVEQLPSATATPTASMTATPTQAPTFTVTPRATSTQVPAPTRTPARMAFSPARPVAPPPASSHLRYFAATRHSLGGPFLTYFLQHGGSAMLGRPLTEPWRKKSATYQLFENTLLRCTGPCTATGGGRVTIEPLGTLVTHGRHFARAALAVTTDNAYRYFPTTHHSLGGAFARFWTAHGDEAFLGLPISEPLTERVVGASKPLRVQYLRNVRLEAWPRGKSGQVVRVGGLGFDYLNMLNTGRAT